MRDIIKLISTSVLTAIVFYFTLGNDKIIFDFIPSDTSTYIDASNMLYDEMKPHPTRPLGYAFISGIPKIIYPNIGENNYIMFGVFVNLLAWVGTIILFYKSLTIYFTNKVSYLFTFGFIFTFSGLSHIFWMLNEPLISFIISLITYYLLKYNKNQNHKYLILSTTLLNLSILIKPGFYYLGIFASLGTIIFILWIHKGVRSKKMFRCFVISILLILVQNISIYRNYEKFTPSFISNTTWYYYLGAESFSTANNIPLKNVIELRRIKLSDKPFKIINQICREDLKSQMINHPHIVLNEWIHNIIENTFSSSSILKVIEKRDENRLTSTFTSLLYTVSSFQSFFFVVIYLFSVVMILKDFVSYNLAIILLLTIITYVVLTSGVSFWQGDRFHYFLYPTIITVFILLIKDKACPQKWLKQ